jgi:hypothetical protein
MIGVGLLTALVLSRGSPLSAQADESVATVPECEIQLSVGSPRAGATEVPLSVVMSGTAFDVNAEEGTGISHIQAFLGPRDEGGEFLGDATFDDESPVGAWTMLANFPADSRGPAVVFVYGQSSSSEMEASLQIPITLADATPPTGSAGAFCPSMVMQPESVMPTLEPSMTNVEWQWTEADDPSAYTITFLDNGLFQARADCNLTSGGYVVEGTNLSLIAGPATLAECPPGSLFDQFLDNLTQVTSFASDTESLVLTLGEAGIEMVFAPNGSIGAPIQRAVD